jgi:hypothetical protein
MGPVKYFEASLAQNPPKNYKVFRPEKGKPIKSNERKLSPSISSLKTSLNNIAKGGDGQKNSKILKMKYKPSTFIKEEIQQISNDFKKKPPKRRNTTNSIILRPIDQTDSNTSFQTPVKSRKKHERIIFNGENLHIRKLLTSIKKKKRKLSENSRASDDRREWIEKWQLFKHKLLQKHLQTEAKIVAFRAKVLVRRVRKACNVLGEAYLLKKSLNPSNPPPAFSHLDNLNKMKKEDSGFEDVSSSSSGFSDEEEFGRDEEQEDQVKQINKGLDKVKSKDKKFKSSKYVPTKLEMIPEASVRFEETLKKMNRQSTKTVSTKPESHKSHRKKVRKVIKRGRKGQIDKIKAPRDIEEK